jgi:hypothetical protein
MLAYDASVIEFNASTATSGAMLAPAPLSYKSSFPLRQSV